MRKAIALSVLVLGLASAAGGRPAPDRQPLATCVGANPCRACKTCKYCKRCAKLGGKCGIEMGQKRR